MRFVRSTRPAPRRGARHGRSYAAGNRLAGRRTSHARSHTGQAQADDARSRQGRGDTEADRRPTEGKAGRRIAQADSRSAGRPAGAHGGRELQGRGSGNVHQGGRCESLGPAEEDLQGERFLGAALFRRAVQAGGSELCRRQSFVDRDSTGSFLSRRGRGQTTRSDGGSPVLVVNELGEVLGRAYPERGVLLAFEPSDEAGQALDESIADHSRAALGGAVRASRRDHDG